MSAAARPELLLALSPLLPPLRFLGRAGLSRLSQLRELGPLLAQAVADARPFVAGAERERLERLGALARGIDEAAEPQRRVALQAVVRELAELVELPAEVLALAAPHAGATAQANASAKTSAPQRSNAIARTSAVARTIANAGARTNGTAGTNERAASNAGPAPRQAGLFEAPPSSGTASKVAVKAPGAAPAQPLDPLATPVEQLRGVGPAIAEKLRGKGLFTVNDLLLFLPRRYEDRRRPRTIEEAPLGERSVIGGSILKVREAKARHGRRLEVLLRDDAGDHLMLIWFHFRSSLLQRMLPGARVLVSGEVKPGYRGGGKTMHHPDVEPLGGDGGLPELRDDDSFGRVVPVYSEIEGVPPRTFRRIARRAIDEYLRFVPDALPPELLGRRKLLGLSEALRESHFPDRFADDAARGRPVEPHRRLAFEELFLVQLGLALRRRGVKVEPGIAFRATDVSLRRAGEGLPWPLTGAQKRALRDISQDMRSPEPMNRLLQGDVGSGKTAVALCAALLAHEDGYQTALMAPTELLAEQHARSLRLLLRERNVHIELVTGALSQRERDHAARMLRTGTAHIVVGTHALAEEATSFHKLGLVVIDEQHRFGVMTRARLMSKGARPDVLVMTATPIPRTLALTLYGDLDVSVLDELPPGRTPVATKVFKDAAREKAYDVIRKELGQGRQAYVVLPLVEESEKLADLKAATKERDRLAVEVFPDVSIGLVHGRQGSAERQEAMERFRSGEDRILVATTVIEVGVDVPNATVMLIEHAERFGLSQLHQLRGRVGRGAARSHCLLVTGTSGAEWGPEARERLKVMEDTTDGFKIAEADLALRGPGEFLGTRQSGQDELSIAELGRDQAILAEAREEAFALVKQDPEFRLPEHGPVHEQLLHRWRGKLSLARVG